MTREDLINQRATTCRHGGHCEWVACDKCNHYEPDVLNQQPCEDCRNCKKWNRCPCGKEGHENGTSIGYSIGECKNYEPCEDCISRQAVLYGLASIAKVKARSDAQKSLMGRIMFFVEQLPPVTPKEKTGHWIFKNDNIAILMGYYQCSECGEGKVLHKDNFCPNCGCRMVEPQESEDKE